MNKLEEDIVRVACQWAAAQQKHAEVYASEIPKGLPPPQHVLTQLDKALIAAVARYKGKR